MFMFFLFKYLLWSFGQIIIINTDLKKNNKQFTIFILTLFFKGSFVEWMKTIYTGNNQRFFFIERISDYRIIGNSGKVGEYNS